MCDAPTTRTDELMRRQYARLSEAAALARAELKPLPYVNENKMNPWGDDDWRYANEHNELIRAKVDGLMTAQEIITQIWKEYLGC